MKKIFLYLITAAIVLISCNSTANKQPTAGKSIPLEGNSYITSEGETGRRGRNAGLFSNWSAPETVYSTYFRVNTPGKLDLYLTYLSEAENNIIEVSCKNKNFTVKLPQAIEEEKTIYIGTVNSEAGYAQVDFKGIKKAGDVYCTPSTLIVEGGATESMNYVDDFSFYWGRRGPSVHMNYPIPEGITAEWFYNEVTIPEGEDPIGSYFMSNGFGEGYFGIQVNSTTERRVLFSVWSPFETDNPKEIPDEHKIIMVKKGENVHTGEFGNEGSGGQSYMKYNWKAGVTYKFLTHIRPAKNNYSEYTSYFYAPEVGEWRLIAQFLRPGTSTYYTRPHSFLENFNNEKGYLGRKGYYNNQWVYTTDKKWVELTHGKFTADATARAEARMDYKGGVDENGFFLQNCGFLDDYTEINTQFERTPNSKQPEIDWDSLK